MPRQHLFVIFDATGGVIRADGRRRQIRGPLVVIVSYDRKRKTRFENKEKEDDEEGKRYGIKNWKSGGGGGG